MKKENFSYHPWFQNKSEILRPCRIIKKMWPLFRCLAKFKQRERVCFAPSSSLKKFLKLSESSWESWLPRIWLREWLVQGIANVVYKLFSLLAHDRLREKLIKSFIGSCQYNSYCMRRSGLYSVASFWFCD